MIEISIEDLNSLLSDLPFNDHYANHIKYISNELKENCNSTVPNTKKELMEKLKFDSHFASLALYFCFQKSEGKFLKLFVFLVNFNYFKF